MQTAKTKLADQRIWAGFYNTRGERLFVLTSKKKDRDEYFLYAVDGENYTLLGKDPNPLVLQEKYHVQEKMRA